MCSPTGYHKDEAIHICECHLNFFFLVHALRCVGLALSCLMVERSAEIGFSGFNQDSIKIAEQSTNEQLEHKSG